MRCGRLWLWHVVSFNKADPRRSALFGVLQISVGSRIPARARAALANGATYYLAHAVLLPHHQALRPRWLLRLGLFIYDHLGGRKLLPKARRVDLRRDPAGQLLQPKFKTAFEYSDCWVEDSRLVVLNLRDAYRRGAKIMPRTKLVTATFIEGRWLLTLEDQTSGRQHNLIAATLVNAAGPWVDEVLCNALGRNDINNIRLVGGSHIVIKRRLSDERSYMFQNADGRGFRHPF